MLPLYLFCSSWEILLRDYISERRSVVIKLHRMVNAVHTIKYFTYAAVVLYFLEQKFSQIYALYTYTHNW